MNPMAVTSRLISVATLGLLFAITAVAGPITVVNFSFEQLPPGGLTHGTCGASSGCWSTGAIPGWLGSTSGSGQFQPGTPTNTLHFNAISDGPTIAYSNVVGGKLFQTVTVTAVAGDTYTLMVDLGRRKDFPVFNGAADLLINGQHILASGPTPAVGQWSTFTATFTAAPTDAGSPITIELISKGIQGDFDNVRLSFAAAPVLGTPEPAGVTLIGLGLVGLVAFARRKRAS